jgi:hypothetical protein
MFNTPQILMIQFDRIKIVTDKKYINHIDSDVSTVVIRNNHEHEIRFKQFKPFNLFVSSNCVNDKGVIEMSAKILGDRYPELINKNNIYQCFEKINTLGVCSLDVDTVINDSKLISCDITVDLDGLTMPDNLTLKSCLKSLNKFQVQKYTNCGYTITKSVKTCNRKMRVSIYDKQKEMLKATNSEYLESLVNKNIVLDYFNGRTRIEANVRTVSQITNLCQTEGNNLLEVLNSTANPLLTIFNTIFAIPDDNEPMQSDIQSLMSYNKLSELKDALLVKECNNDPTIIDMVLNNCLSPNTNKCKYKARLTRLINAQPLPNKNIQVMRNIKNKLHDYGCSV